MVAALAKGDFFYLSLQNFCSLVTIRAASEFKGCGYSIIATVEVWCNVRGVTKGLRSHLEYLESTNKLYERQIYLDILILILVIIFEKDFFIIVDSSIVLF